MDFSTADLCDAHLDIEVFEGSLISYGKKEICTGHIVTVEIEEDNSKVIECLEKEGKGKILIVDVLGELCAVVGDRLAGIAIKNGWEGIVVNGYIRDTKALKQMDIGIWAKGVFPRRSKKTAEGIIGNSVSFGGVTFEPESYLYIDRDGIILSKKELNL